MPRTQTPSAAATSKPQPRIVPTVFKENIVTTVPVKFKLPFWQRFGALFGREIKVNVMVITQCQHSPGKTQGKFSFTLHRKGFRPDDVIQNVNSDNPKGEDVGQTREKI